MDRILYGAGQIGAFLWPNELPKRRKRRVYHLASGIREVDRLPVFRIGEVLCARPKALAAWVRDRERAAADRSPEAA